MSAEKPSDTTHTPSEFYFHACCFLEAAQLASQHRHKQPDKGKASWNNFEGIIVGTHHAVAAELLIKVIMLSKLGDFKYGHNLNKLISSAQDKGLFSDIEDDYPGGKNQFKQQLKSHAEMFVEMRYPSVTHPPTLDMDFTSYLCGALKAKLKVICGL